MTKKCSKCKKIKLVSEFGKNRSRNNGLQHCCKLCRNDLQKIYHKNNINKINESGKKYYNIRMIKSIKYLGGKCILCNITKQLQFHHIIPRVKGELTIATMMTFKWDVLKPELDKCVLLCRNCHRSIHRVIKEVNKF